ncbi:hypothetical protein [Novosphingobium sp. FSW06-99]|uniref:hypothetical protein n=1 Tax=Novosphingobium sp. FSW06-99 TaxID=1739113 RepID=UPI00076BFF2E|nr:hypothetical protein [Novosphingobium sp. FSW06-99]KUR80924.1 hypothetical protein AQZ49_02555 [Novosphingobium sp. FSW06-99]
MNQRTHRASQMARMNLGCRAKAGDEVAGRMHTSRTAMEPVSRADVGRTTSATSEIMDVTAGENAPEFQIPGAGFQTDDKGSDCDALTAEVLNGSALGAASIEPVNVSECPTFSQPARLALPTSSAMDDMAAASRMSVAQARAHGRLDVPFLADGADGKFWCATCEWRKPLWFGRDCIEAGCALKGRA